MCVLGFVKKAPCAKRTHKMALFGSNFGHFSHVVKLLGWACVKVVSDNIDDLWEVIKVAIYNFHNK